VAQQTLAELIESRRWGRSYQRLMDESPGRKPTASRWHQLVNKPLEDFPRAVTMEHIATVLRVAPFAVARACCASLGWGTGLEPARSVELLDRLGAYDLKRLQQDQVEAVVAVAVAMLAKTDPTMPSGR
jgi:hypothetical protein